MKTEKRDSADYGLFCFRLSREEREEISLLVEQAKERLNKDKAKNEYIITKNKILFEAIKLGLPLVKKDR